MLAEHTIRQIAMRTTGPTAGRRRCKSPEIAAVPDARERRRRLNQENPPCNRSTPTPPCISCSRRRMTRNTPSCAGSPATPPASWSWRAAAATWQRAWRAADVTGVDASPEMVALATQAHGDRPGLCFVQGDMRTLRLERPFEWPSTTRCSTPARRGVRGAGLDQGAHGTALARCSRPACASETLDAESCTAEVGSAIDACGVTFEIYGTSTFDPATRVNHRVFEIHKDGAKVAERTLSMRILDSAALQQRWRAPASASRARSTSRARKSSRKPGPAPRTPSAPMNAAPDRERPALSTRWRGRLSACRARLPP